MVSSCCEALTDISNNSEWCTNCGMELKTKCQWVIGYFGYFEYHRMCDR